MMKYIAIESSQWQDLQNIGYENKVKKNEVTKEYRRIYKNKNALNSDKSTLIPGEENLLIGK